MELKPLKDRRRMLKVKLKSLMAESKIIRFEEKKSRDPLRYELWEHRVKDLRGEARHTHLAYGLIKGYTLDRIEQKSETKPDWLRVKTMIAKYGPVDAAAKAALINGLPKKE